jgi:hypothetical protein
MQSLQVISGVAVDSADGEHYRGFPEVFVVSN